MIFEFNTIYNNNQFIISSIACSRREISASGMKQFWSRITIYLDKKTWSNYGMELMLQYKGIFTRTILGGAVSKNNWVFNQGRKSFRTFTGVQFPIIAYWALCCNKGDYLANSYPAHQFPNPSQFIDDYHF